MTVSSKRSTSWKTIAKFLNNVSGSTLFTSTPPKVIWPESASQNRAANFEAVDLPLPDGPTKAVTSPCFAVKETPFNTGSSL